MNLSVKLGVLVIGFSIFSYSEVWGADWKLFASNSEMGDFYYDVQHITRPSKDIVRVWVRLKYTDKGVSRTVKELGKAVENLSYAIGLEEMNCSGKRTRTLFVSHYSKEKTVLHTSSRYGEWTNIVPDSNWEDLYKAVCKEDGKGGKAE